VSNLLPASALEFHKGLAFQSLRVDTFAVNWCSIIEMLS
jgi:hypothetical protein